MAGTPPPPRTASVLHALTRWETPGPQHLPPRSRATTSFKYARASTTRTGGFSSCCVLRAAWQKRCTRPSAPKNDLHTTRFFQLLGTVSAEHAQTSTLKHTYFKRPPCRRAPRKSLQRWRGALGSAPTGSAPLGSVRSGQTAPPRPRWRWCADPMLRPHGQAPHQRTTAPGAPRPPTQAHSNTPHRLETVHHPPTSPSPQCHAMLMPCCLALGGDIGAPLSAQLNRVRRGHTHIPHPAPLNLPRKHLHAPKRCQRHKHHRKHGNPPCTDPRARPSSACASPPTTEARYVPHQHHVHTINHTHLACYVPTRKDKHSRRGPHQAPQGARHSTLASKPHAPCTNSSHGAPPPDVRTLGH